MQPAFAVEERAAFSEVTVPSSSESLPVVPSVVVSEVSQLSPASLQQPNPHSVPGTAHSDAVQVVVDSRYLAELITDVLGEQARRHGVDLS